MPLSDPESRIQHILDSFPAEGLFRDKEWLMSPDAFPLEPHILQLLQDLGPALRQFQTACNDLYFHSIQHPDSPYGWVAPLLDQGKPPAVVELGRHPAWRSALPSVIRPDLILTETGVTLSEIDSLPGGIGLLAWLNETYAQLDEPVIGGAFGMIDGFAEAFPNHNILISRESSDYEPEMQWIASRTSRTVHRTWDITHITPGSYYRFFELFDLHNVEHSTDWLAAAQAGQVHFTPPLKAFLEEKLWLALFWSPQLTSWWSQNLTPHNHQLLQQVIPMGWVFDPQPLPEWAIYPDINVQSWTELKAFGNKARELVLKISGFSERGWGSRGVTIGHDHSRDSWSAAIDQALASFPTNPYILQRFHKGKVLQHPTWNPTRRDVKPMKARVRLCPYYFVIDNAPQLSGVLATVCPSDKKILHGMKDAIMLPCR
ncbi:MAG: hypothetical protein JNJ83_20435 [Verrucomicrobiaceae bacterium]|nr:hypothetical protein [Verrucomicrobiaceae bacterium]